MKNVEVTICNDKITLQDHETSKRYWIESHQRFTKPNEKFYKIEYRVWACSGLDSFEGGKPIRSIHRALKQAESWIKNDRHNMSVEKVHRE